MADQPDVNKALIDLLVKKGVLTQQDVSNLQQEIAAAQQAAPAPQAAAMPAQQTTTTMTTSSGPVGAGSGPAFSGASGAGVPVPNDKEFRRWPFH